jgi:hypothetical protein
LIGEGGVGYLAQRAASVGLGSGDASGDTTAEDVASGDCADKALRESGLQPTSVSDNTTMTNIHATLALVVMFIIGLLLTSVALQKLIA